MSWSFLGKLLVVVHAALSIGVLAWAFGVYTHRIDWNNPPAAAGTTARKKASTPSRQPRRPSTATRPSALTPAGPVTWPRYRPWRPRRYPRRAYYSTKIVMVQTGLLNGQPVANPVTHLPLGPNGYLDVRDPAAGQPVEVRAGVPAVSLNQYEQAIAKLIEDTKASQEKNAQAITDRDKLNREIVGVKDPFAKGLRQLVNEQKTIEDQANFEDAYIIDAVTNREAEFGLLKKRRDALVQRGRVEEEARVGQKGRKLVEVGNARSSRVAVDTPRMAAISAPLGEIGTHTTGE